MYRNATKWRHRPRIVASLAAVALVTMACAGGTGEDADVEPVEEPDDTATDDETEDGAEAEGDVGEEATGELRTITAPVARPGPSVLLSYMYVPMEMGYFEEEGIEVELEYTGGSAQAIQLILAGQGLLTLPDPATILNAAGQGQDVQTVYQRSYGSVFEVIVPAGGDITAFEGSQLDGTNIGISEFSGGEVPALRAALAEEGLDPETDVELLPIGGGEAQTLQALQDGTVDLYVSSKPDMSALANAGLEFNRITPEEWLTFPGNSMVVTGENLESERETIVGFLRALAKGNVFHQENLEAALQIAEEYAPESFDDPESARNFLESLFPLDITPDGIDQIGGFDREGWGVFQDYLLAGGVEGFEAGGDPVDIDALLNDSLLADINDFDEAAVREDAANY